MAKPNPNTHKNPPLKQLNDREWKEWLAYVCDRIAGQVPTKVVLQRATPPVSAAMWGKWKSIAAEAEAREGTHPRYIEVVEQIDAALAACADGIYSKMREFLDSENVTMRDLQMILQARPDIEAVAGVASERPEPGVQWTLDIEAVEEAVVKIVEVG